MYFFQLYMIKKIAVSSIFFVNIYIYLLRPLDVYVFLDLIPHFMALLLRCCSTLSFAWFTNIFDIKKYNVFFSAVYDKKNCSQFHILCKHLYLLAQTIGCICIFRSNTTFYGFLLRCCLPENNLEITPLESFLSRYIGFLWFLSPVKVYFFY